jgi:hypothetical protein
MTAHELRELLEYDSETGVFTRKKKRKRWGVGEVAGCTSNGYTTIGLNYAVYQAHRLAWLYWYGAWPNGPIDHINGDRKDNRIKNLRLATPAINSQNQRRPRSGNTAGELGVTSHKQGPHGFRAKIHYKGRTLHLGLYDTAEEAHDVYVKVKRALHEGCTL